jgi:DNA modification methylase
MDFHNLYVGDNLHIIQSFSDSCINQIVTSPPYDGARNYHGFPALTSSRIMKLSKQFYRILTDGGVLCWNVNDMSDGNGGESLNSFRQALIFQKVGFHVKPIIWEKTIFNPCGNFYYDVKEYIFVCHKGRGKYFFNPIHDVVTSYNDKRIRFGKFTKRDKNGEQKEVPKEREMKAKPGEKYMRKRGNIWKGNTAAQENPCQALYGHAPMPEWLARDLILSFSNEKDVVLDPFSGGGTTWKVATELNRQSVNIEISEQIAKESRERLSHVNPVML